MFTLPKLPYSYHALEPWIEARTMEFHHSKHHQTYVTKLNEALDKHPELKSKSLEDLLTNLEAIPADIRTAVKNHGGGHYNHTLFWQVLAPASDSKPEGELATAINQAFGSFDSFREKMTAEAVNHFGSGWGWLCVDPAGKLVVTSSHDQECPITKGLYPLHVVDVWEHAYYLQYQNLRAAFVNAHWNIVNWKEIGNRFKTKKRLLETA